MEHQKNRHQYLFKHLVIQAVIMVVYGHCYHLYVAKFRQVLFDRLNDLKKMINNQKITPPQLYKTFIGLMFLIFVFAEKKVIHFPYNLSGLLFLITGSYMALSTKKMFKRTNTPIPPTAMPEKLHTKGIFKYTRNPMYLGIVMALLGVALLTGMLINMLFPVLYLVILDRFYIVQEEKNLADVFGLEYFKYKSSVRRWL
ncbi:isoprenylcysteine carboxylmethyltransferase family protein [Fulvivirgaceae bacterium BMA12]|uniref:Isoprenylcysteine carboxylmethyltransferase family protein n=1 Tax=Agaribacillus aureus TaxID=3051825 RepID=A0ABT8LJH4_9BACT|nr:isoprenylcysteine carboxylmethyltransferase family protein [Fulvivirgaceae bacterium BMA12]